MVLARPQAYLQLYRMRCPSCQLAWRDRSSQHNRNPRTLDGGYPYLRSNGPSESRSRGRSAVQSARKGRARSADGRVEKIAESVQKQQYSRTLRRPPHDPSWRERPKASGDDGTGWGRDTIRSNSNHDTQANISHFPSTPTVDRIINQVWPIYPLQDNFKVRLELNSVNTFTLIYCTFHCFDDI